MTDVITPADLEAFDLAPGFPCLAPALKRHVQSVIRTAVAQIGTLQGPGRKLIGDALADEAVDLASPAGMVITNPVENQIRPIALTRKNALFAGNEVGAENWPMLASLVATCKLSDVNPVDYIDATLRAILDGHPQSRIEDLMPWRFNLPSSIAAQGSGAALRLKPP